jgi:hypothetical protein
MAKWEFSLSVHFGGLLDYGYVSKLYLPIPNLKVEFNNFSKSGLWFKIHQLHPEISHFFCSYFMEKSENSKNQKVSIFNIKP